MRSNSPTQGGQGFSSDLESPYRKKSTFNEELIQSQDNPDIIIEPKVKSPKQKQKYITRLSNVFYVYLKLLMGRELEEEEDDQFLAYLDQSDIKRIIGFKKSFEYVNEFDYNMGDVILTFPNPDSDKISSIKQLNPMEAIDLCLNCFNLKNSGSDYEVMDNLIFLKAIEQCIFMLDRAHNDDEGQLDNDERDKKTSKRGLQRFGKENDLVALAANKIDNKLQEIKSKGNKMPLIKEVFNLDYEQLKKREKIKYKMSKGGFLIQEEKKWFQSKQDTHDFSTLIRHIVMIQLTKCGFSSRQFISKDGKYIYIVLYQCDQNLKIVAQQHSIQKQLNFQFSDLLSLEPVDLNFRPLRLNSRLWKDAEELGEEYSETFTYLKPKILQLLEEINFKKIARELNLSQLNQQLFTKESVEDIIDNGGPTDKVWEAYYAYLIFMNTRIHQIREDYQMSNNQALKVNKSKEPFKLYRQCFPNDENIEKITQQDLHLLQNMQKEQEIQQIPLKDRPQTIYNTFKAIFQIIQEQQQIQQKFSLIRDYLHLPPNKFISSKHIKVCKREKLAHQYYELFKEALAVSNYVENLLITIWDLIGEESFEPYINYQITPDKIPFSQQSKMNSIWKKYSISETGRTSLFSTMERMKLTNLALGEKVNFSILFSRKLAEAAFCLNDDFELHGKSHKQYFDSLFNEEYDTELILKEAQYPQFYKQIQINKCPNKYILNEYEYVQSKLENLEFIWRLNYKKPWFIPTQEIRDYYGEKIALYFTFLGYYTQMLLPIGIAGLIISIIQLIVWNEREYNYVMPQIIFGMIQIQWANLIFDLWQQREKIFSIKYGQNNDEGTQQTQQRSDFVGQYERSIENDNLNTLNYSDYKKFGRITATLLIQVFILGIYVGIIIGIFFISEKLQQNQTLKKLNANNTLQLGVTIPALVNQIVILILDPFFEKTSATLTDYENHKTINEYETNFVFKKYFMSFFALCGPIVEIMFGHEKVGLNCIDDDCLKHAQYHFASMFLLQFSMNIWEILKPKLTTLWRQFTQQSKEDEPSIKKLEQQKSQQVNDDIESNQQTPQQQILKQTDIQNILTKNDQNPFEKINNYIENEFLYKSSYVISPERYGTVDEYMEITLQYSMLVLFGTTFPLCYTIAFIWNVLELQTDKLKLLNDMQRPLPLGESTIGVWNGVLEGLAYLSLVSNSGLIAYSRDRIINYNETVTILGFFLIILLSNFFLRYIESSIFGEIPYEIKSLMQRHQYLIKSTIEKFLGSSEKQDQEDKKNKIDMKRFTLHKMYGSLLQNKLLQKYEEMSSDSEIEEYYVKRSPQKKINKLKGNTNHKFTKINVFQEEEQLKKKKKEELKLLERYFQKRPSNWAFKFKITYSTDSDKQQQQKEFFLKTLRFLKIINQLNSHKILWLDDRFTYRKLFLPRYLVLVRNLDWRRTLTLQNNQKDLKIKLKQQQQNKYKEQLQILNQNQQIDSNRIEKLEILRMIQEYIKHHLWIDGRKTVMIRQTQGVWFHQYRKSTLKKQSIRICKDFLSLLQSYKNTFPKGNVTERNIDEQFQNYIKQKTQTQILNYKWKDYIAFIDTIKCIPQRLLFPLTSKQLTQVEQELDDFIPLELRKQQNILNLTYVPYRIQAPYYTILQQQILDLFIQQQLAKDQPPLIIILPLDTKRSLHTATLEYNVFSPKQQLFRWLVTQIEKPRLDQTLVLYITDIWNHRILHRDILNRTTRFYEKITDMQYIDLNLKIPIAPLKYFKAQPENLIINIRDPILKGTLSRAYGPPKGFGFCNGKSLKEVLQSRSSYYSDQEICDFIGSVLETISFVETEQGMYHGNLNLQTILLIKNMTPTDQWYTFCIIDFGMFYWYDFEEEKVYFTRAIEQNDELWYLSPELITNYLNPKQQIPISPQKCDAYALGMIGLQMATLGKMGIEIEKALREQEGEVEKAVKRWIVNSKQQLTMKYPNTMNMVLQLINPDQNQRLYPSKILSKHKNIAPFREQEVRINFEEALFHQRRQNEQPKITKDQMVRIFDGKSTMLNANIKEKISIQEYLKQSIYKLELYLKLYQLELLQQESAQFEQIMLQQFFYQLPYAKETGDFITCFENYCLNQVYEILENDIHELKYLNIYLLIRVQLCILQQEFKEAQALTLKSTDIIKGVEITCKHLLRDIAQKNEEEREKIQDIHLQIVNREQLYELQVSKDRLIRNCIEDKDKLKQIKKLPQKLKQYLRFFQLALIQIYHLQQQYQLASDICEEYMIDSHSEIIYNVKHSKKNSQDQFIIKEDIIIRILGRLKVYSQRIQIYFDSWKESDFQSVHDFLNELNILHNYLKPNDEENLDEIDKRRSSLTKQQIQNTQLKVKEDFQRSIDHTLQQLYRQGKYLQILSLNRSKDVASIKKRLRTYSKYFIQQQCLLTQLTLIPQIGWVCEYYAEIGDDQSCINIYLLICDMMEECFFMIESFGLKTEIYQTYLKRMLSLLIFYCLQSLYYNQIKISDGILQGYMQLIRDMNIFGSSDILASILMIKIIHCIIHLQRHQYPNRIHHQSTNAIEIHQKVFEQSLIKLLHSNYKLLIPYFYDEYQGKYIQKQWLNHGQMYHLVTELVQGYFFVMSLINLEGSDDPKLEIFLKSIEAKHVSQEMASNRNSFVIIENCLIRSRLCILIQEYTQLEDLLNQMWQALESITEEFILQSEMKQLMQCILLTKINLIINQGYENQIKYSKIQENEQLIKIQENRYFDIKLLIMQIIDNQLKNQQLELVEELISFTILLFENRANLFTQTHASFYQTLMIYRVRIFAIQEEARIQIFRYDKNKETQIEDLFEQVQNAQQYTKKTFVSLDVAKYLISQSLEQNEMNQIKKALAQIQNESTDNQIVLCQLALKLIIYQMHTGQYKEADIQAIFISERLYQIIFSHLQQVCLKWQGEKQFIKNSKKEIKIEDLFLQLKVIQSYDKYEHNVLSQLEPIKELFINARKFKELKQVIYLRNIFQYLESLHTMAIAMKGDYKLAQSNLQFIDKFSSQSVLEEIITLNTTILMQIDLISQDYTKAIQKSTQIILTIEEIESLLHIELKMGGSRHYVPIVYDQLIQIQKPELEFIKPLIFSYDQALSKSSLRPYLELNRLKTECFLCYLEASIQVPQVMEQQQQIQNLTDQLFSVQKYIQQQYGSQHIFNGHIQRLIANLYSEILQQQKIKELENIFIDDSENKIILLKNELNEKLRIHLESKIKNKCTNQMNIKFQQNKLFLQEKIDVLQGISDGITLEVVSRWAIQAADQSYQIYKLFCEEYKYEYNPQMSYLFQIYSDIYFVQNRIVSTMKYLEEAKNSLEYCQSTIYNPDFCKLTFRQGFLRQNIQSMVKLYIEALMGLTLLTPTKKLEVLTFILKEDKSYLQHFDNFKTHNFVKFLELNIAKQLEDDTLTGKRLPDLQRKDQKKLCQFLQVEGDKLAFQLTLDSKTRLPPNTIEAILKEGIESIAKEKIKMDYSGEDYFQKAYQIAKSLLTIDNPLCQKLEFYAIKQKSKGKGRRTSVK